jgi:hypothetical protein
MATDLDKIYLIKIDENGRKSEIPATEANFLVGISGAANFGYESIIGNGVFASNILGGSNNQIHISRSTIVGGGANIISGINPGDRSSYIGGGFRNCAIGCYNVVNGGFFNKNNGLVSVIGGGDSNSLISDNGFIGGGRLNCLIGNNNYSIEEGNLSDYSIIVGGRENRISGQESFIGGGSLNRICGGVNSYIGGGALNTVCASCASILGGIRNIINSGHIGATLISDSQNRNHTSSGPHTLTLDFASGIYVNGSFYLNGREVIVSAAGTVYSPTVIAG